MLSTNHLPASAPPVSLPPVTLSPEGAAPPADRFADLDAERRLLAATLRDPAAMSTLKQPLLLCDFFLLEHRCLLYTCQRLRQAEADCTPQALEAEFQDHPHCDALLVVRTLRKLPPAFDHRTLDDCAQQVRHAARQRRLLDLLETASARFRDGLSFDTLRHEATEYFTSVALNPPSGKAANPPSLNATLPPPVNTANLSVNITTPPVNDFDGSLAAFLADPLNDTEEMIPALHRGEVAELLADEAQGKTALLLQLGLSLAAGESQSPLLETAETERAPRRVVYVNGEAAARRLRDDIERLLPQLTNQEEAKANFRILYEQQLDGKPLLLYNEASWRRLADWLRRQRPDLIILDGVAALDPERSKPSQRREQGSKVFANLRELAKQANCAVLVAHSTVSNGNRRRLGNALFSSADAVYHFRSDHRYRDDYRQFRCVQSRWRVPEAVGLQGGQEAGGYEVAPEPPMASTGTGKAAKRELPTIAELVEYLAPKWQEKSAIVQYFEGRATLYEVEKLIKEAHLLGWIFRRYSNLPWQLDERGKAYIAEKKAQAEADAKKNADTTIAEEARNNSADAEGNDKVGGENSPDTHSMIEAEKFSANANETKGGAKK